MAYEAAVSRDGKRKKRKKHSRILMGNGYVSREVDHSQEGYMCEREKVDVEMAAHGWSCSKSLGNPLQHPLLLLCKVCVLEL